MARPRKTIAQSNAEEDAIRRGQELIDPEDRFANTLEKDIALCQNIIKLQSRINMTGYTQVTACQEAGYPYKDTSRASSFIKKKMRDPKFVALLDHVRAGRIVDSYEEIESELGCIDTPRKILKAYSKLYDLTTNITVKDAKGTPTLYNPGQARQILRDLGEHLNMFTDKQGSSLAQTVNSIQEIDNMIAKLQRIEIKTTIESSGPKVIEVVPDSSVSE